MTESREAMKKRYQRVLSLIEISEKVVSASKTIKEPLKTEYLSEYKDNRADADDYFNQRKGGYLKQLENEILTPWNETYDEDSDRFWSLVRDEGMDLEREDHLVNILKRGKIANFTEHEIVEDSIVIWQQEGRITEEQAGKLDDMLAEFEKNH